MLSCYFGKKKYKKRCDFIKTLYLCAKFIKQIKIYKKMAKKRLIATSLDESQFDEIEKYANERGLTLSSVVRIAIIDWIKQLTDSVNPKNEKTT